MEKPISSTKKAFDLAKIIVNEIIKGYVDLDDVQIQNMSTRIAPFIGNVMYEREQDLLEHERFITLMRLSKVLDEKQMTEAINYLKYELKSRSDEEK